MPIQSVRFNQELLRPLESTDREQLIEFIAILLDIMMDRPNMLEVALETIRRQPRSSGRPLHVADSLIETLQQSTAPLLTGHEKTIHGHPRSSGSSSHASDSLIGALQQSTSPPLSIHETFSNHPELDAPTVADRVTESQALGRQDEPMPHTRSRSRPQRP